MRAEDVLLVLPAHEGPFHAGNMVFFHAAHGFSMGFASSTNLSTGDRGSDIEMCPASENVSESSACKRKSVCLNPLLTHPDADDAGARTVNGRTSRSQTIKATVAVTVTASGKLLEPLIVFKGKPGGRIESREFATYPPGAVYACQDAA